MDINSFNFSYLKLLTNLSLNCEEHGKISGIFSMNDEFLSCEIEDGMK